MAEILIKTGEVTLKDEAARQAIEKMMMDIDKINERTKIHTIRIREWEKSLKNVEQIIAQYAKKL